MSNILIAYGSLTGNTMGVAEWIADAVKGAGHTAKLVDCANLASPEGLCGPFDLVVFGSPTYGDNPCEVQEDFEPVLDALETTGVTGKKVAVFGLGDSSYTHFCGAVDMIVERVQACGGSLVGEPLRIDDPHYDHESEVRQWAAEVAAAA